MSINHLKTVKIIARFNKILQALDKEQVTAEIAEQMDLTLANCKNTLDGLVFVGLAKCESKSYGRLCVPTNHYIRISNAEFVFEDYLVYKEYLARAKAELEHNKETLAQPTIPGGRIIRFSESELSKRYSEQYKLNLDERRKNRKIEVRKNSTLA